MKKLLPIAIGAVIGIPLLYAAISGAYEAEPGDVVDSGSLLGWNNVRFDWRVKFTDGESPYIAEMRMGMPGMGPEDGWEFAGAKATQAEAVALVKAVIVAEPG